MKTAGQVFVKLLIVGIILLIAGVLFGRLSNLDGKTESMFLASYIIIITLIVIGGYTFAIATDSQRLGDLDAPDLAYYLGFSLTVAALAITFLVDIFAAHSTSVQGQGDLIKRSLSQFGAGLLATLVGLNAKIYLTSKQSNKFPEEPVIYNQFRYEIGEFRSLMLYVSNELKSQTERFAQQTISSTDLISQSINKFSEQVNKSSQILAEQLNTEKISAPILNFINELNTIHLPVTDLKKSISNLEADINNSKNGFSKFSEAISKSNIQFELSTAKHQLLEKAIVQIKETFLAFNNTIIETKTKTDETIESLKSISTASLRYSKNITKADEAVVKITDSTVNSTAVLESFSNSTKSIIEKQRVFEEVLSQLQKTLVKENEILEVFDKNLKSINSQIENTNNLIVNNNSELNKNTKILIDLNNNIQNFSNILTPTNNQLKTTLEIIEYSNKDLKNLSSEVNIVINAIKQLNNSVNTLKNDLNNK